MAISLIKPDTVAEYREVERWLNGLKGSKQISAWGDAMRWYCQNDLFYLLNFVLSDGRTMHSETQSPLFLHQFYLDWCRQIEWQEENGGGSDHSCRRGGKSTLRTKAGNIKRIITHPDSSGCIFSYERKAAKKHFRTIKTELEENNLLKTLFDDILYEDPQVAAKNGDTIWSVDEGLKVKRSRNRSTLTLEYNAFKHGTPTGGGYDRLDFDDIEDHSALTSPEMIEALHKAYGATVQLLTPAVLARPQIFFTNTFYSEAGLAKKVYNRYVEIDPRKVRKVPGEDLLAPGPGPAGGSPLYPFTTSILKQKWDETDDKREYFIQVCCDFVSGEERRLEPSSCIRYTDAPETVGQGRNVYICIDPSSGRGRDPTVMWVWGLGLDRKAAWLDVVRKKLDPALAQFHDEIFMLYAKWNNIGRVVEIRVEEFGQTTYATLIARELQQRGVYGVPILQCHDNMRTGLFGSGKSDREFERWAMPLQRGEVLIPTPVSEGGAGLVRSAGDGTPVKCLVDYFITQEMANFPNAITDDMLDAGSLLWEPAEKIGTVLQFPSAAYRRRNSEYSYGRGARRPTWMSAG